MDNFMDNFESSESLKSNIQRIFITRSDETRFCSTWISFFQKGSLKLSDFSPKDVDLHQYFKSIFDKGINEEKAVYFTETVNSHLLSFHFFPEKILHEGTDSIIKQVFSTNLGQDNTSIGIYLDHKILDEAQSAYFLSSLIKLLKNRVENFYLLTNDLGLNSALNIAKSVKRSNEKENIVLYH